MCHCIPPRGSLPSLAWGVMDGLLTSPLTLDHFRPLYSMLPTLKPANSPKVELWFLPASLLSAEETFDVAVSVFAEANMVALSS